MGEIPYEYDETRSDGKIIVRTNNTIALLNEWFRSRFRTSDWQPFEATIKTLRKIRQQRQRPAHAIDDNVFDQQFIRQQRELILEAYDALRTIRLMLANHHSCQSIKVDEVLFEGKIWTI